MTPEPGHYQAAVRGTGEAADGRVRVVVSQGGMASLVLEPQVLRSSPEKLACLLVEAVNAAFEDLAALLAEERSGLNVDPLELARQLRLVRADLEAQMERVTDSISTSAAELRKDAEVPAEIPSMDFGDMFDQLIGVLETIGGVPDGEEEPVGEGSAGRVTVACAAGPRLVSMTIHPRAMQGTGELCEHVVAAVNGALADLAVSVGRHRANAGADPEEIRARIAGLQELGVARMREYGQTAARLMGGIRPHD